jgi:hypothetical protein
MRFFHFFSMPPGFAPVNRRFLRLQRYAGHGFKTDHNEGKPTTSMLET